MGKRKTKPRGKPLILVSNDDGVGSKGIVVLSRALRALGRVVVVAPDKERSASSHSITLHRPLRVERLSRDEYSADGTPTDCVLLAVHGLLGQRPDLIVSGVNHGPNLGDDVHYSGTVSVAFEGGILGIPSIAVSCMGSGSGLHSAAEIACEIGEKVLRRGLPRGIVLNVNVPDLPMCMIKGVSVTKQGKRNYGGVIVEKTDPRGKKYYWIGGDQSGFEDVPRSDCNAVRAGFVSITPLRVNLSDRAGIGALARLGFASKKGRAKR
ncbi:MAG: 5'/3'-nucleotidase SurE [Proteobacteria bacterium]|nr:5'/3'-nucleotidase SurE [Pseudomonadota bacterium]